MTGNDSVKLYNKAGGEIDVHPSDAPRLKAMGWSSRKPAKNKTKEVK